MGSNSRDFVVSPYLVSIPDEAVDEWSSANQHPNAAMPAEVYASIAGKSMFRDMLSRRLVVTTREDKLRLERLRHQADGIAGLAASEPAVFQLFVDSELLLPEADAFRKHQYTTVEIEINRHCNFRCSFCPVESAPKPRAFMTPELYALILDRVEEYGARAISLNHYSEPSLDPTLVERVRLAAEHGLMVRLHTNASLLDEEKIRALAALGNLSLVVNLPTVDRAEYERVTGAKLFDRVLANLRLIHEHGIPTQLSINTPRESGDEDVQRINELFASMFGRSAAWPTDSRAGLIEKDDYAVAVQHRGRLAGCRYALSQINVAHDGKVFLCCQDFDQQYVLGDLRRNTLREIAEGERMVQLRRWIFGYEEPPADFICSRCSWTQPLGAEPGPLTVGTEVRRLQKRASQAGTIPPWPLIWAVSAPEP